MRNRRNAGFTLIELLTVIVVILILAGLVLSISTYAQKKAAMSRAQAEIQAMSAACESYKSDNGIYPEDVNTDLLDPKASGNPSYPSPGTYAKPSLVLYRALSGDTNCDGAVDNTDGGFTISGSSQTPPTGVKPTTYMSFAPNQLLARSPGTTVSTANPVVAIADPFGNCYGYGTAYQADLNTGTNPPTRGYNPTFDLWCTSGNIVTGVPQSTDTAKWITNW